MAEMICNLCGGTVFRRRRSRPNVVCVTCGSAERTRAMHLVLKVRGIIQPGMRVMQVAPDRGITRFIESIEGVSHTAYDLHPELFDFCQVKKLDLVADLPAMKSESFDVIIHSHVMEHIPCNVTAVLFHLNRLLTRKGVQVCVIPFLPGHSEEDFGAMADAVRVQRFGQADHVRRFGVADLQQTLGMVYRLPAKYDLERIVPAELLDRHNVPAYARKGFSAHTVLTLRRKDFLLREKLYAEPAPS